MKTADELTTRFREQGLRVTPQRQAIFRLLHGHGAHPTVESLYESARAEMPTISLKTVYQTVHDLADMGEVKVINLGTGATRVDPNVEHPHHHLICTGCGLVRDLPLDLLDSGADLRVPARLRHGFSVSSVEVNFRGLCEGCASNTDAQTQNHRS